MGTLDPSKDNIPIEKAAIDLYNFLILNPLLSCNMRLSRNKIIQILTFNQFCLEFVFLVVLSFV